MASKIEKYNQRRLRGANASVVVSISLVLFLLGVLGILVINAQNLAREVKENFQFTVYLKDSAKEVEVRSFQKDLALSDQVKEIEFISKEEAAEEFQETLGEDFVDFLGFNPLQDALAITLKSQYVSTENISEFETELLGFPWVAEVNYDKDLLQQVNDNIQKIGIFLAGGIFLLLIISIALINSSIRLSIYSKRFIIKTMQLVGATRFFIQKPFLMKSIRTGLIGAIFAGLLLTGILYIGDQQLPELDLLSQQLELMAVGGGLLLVGIFISWICTWFAVRKYLNLKTDELYF
ncbi:MAG: permease-like cell division protein FtsX [Schleiferiaceae bacterium]|jgi:cell division transport system permease protein